MRVCMFVSVFVFVSVCRVHVFVSACIHATVCACVFVCLRMRQHECVLVFCECVPCACVRACVHATVRACGHVSVQQYIFRV